MAKQLSVDEAADYADLERHEVAAVLCFLVDDGWLSSSHFEENPFDVAQEARR